jgi:D-alanine-D-alanine ligase
MPRPYDPAGPVLVLYNADEALSGGIDAEAVQGVLESVTAVEAVLRGAGAEARSVGVPDGRAVLDAVEAVRPRLVFNLVESLEGRSELESASAFLLEMLGVPYTGSGPRALALCQDKPMAKAALRGLGLPTASWRVLTRDRDRAGQLRDLDSLRFPCIVKPAATDASHGIEPGSVVRDPAAALDRAGLLWDRYGPAALCEEYIAGREINVAIVGSGAQAECLPLSEIDFHLAEGLPNIVTYAAKWIDGSREWGASEVLCPAPLDPAAAAAVERAALAAYRGFGCRDYGRVDLRLTPALEPVILEVNPNPDLAPTAGLARSAGHKPWSYDELIESILAAALDRSVPGARAPA